MRSEDIFLAIDLGAGSGRILAGEYKEGKISLTELNRFENNPIENETGYHWDIETLLENILAGLSLAAEKYGERIASIGIDTWGVDYGLIGRDGELLNAPHQYRDPRTDGMMERAFAKMPQEDIYKTTGIQFMFFNTLFQLLAESGSEHSNIAAAQDLLFTPDLIGYLLTGNKVQERAIASTSQLYNPITRDWDRELIAKMGLPSHLFKSLTDAGTVLGQLKDSIAQKTGLQNVVVVTVAGHDTACAVAGVPSREPQPVFLSSGTWSLMGIELPAPIISEASFRDAFTNEIGANDTVRFLKNISGLWLIQESRRTWKEAGEDIPYETMATLAREEEPFRSLIDPDHPSLASAGNMPGKVQDLCRQTGQPIPETPGQIIRCIYESLALRYATVWRKLQSYAAPSSQLHVVGGGSLEPFLNQATADAIQAPVITGPTEATGTGNILVQMMAHGAIDSLAEGRAIVANSFALKTYHPKDPEIWEQAMEKFYRIEKETSNPSRT